jgi:hypothetical protein
MKRSALMIPVIVAAVLWLFTIAPGEGLAAEAPPLFKDYQVVEVSPFEVPTNVAAPDSAGRTIADETLYQIRRYSAKFNLFDMVFMEGTQKVPPGKKVLLVKGTVTAYSPKGAGTCAVHCQLVDKVSGQILHEIDPNGLIFRVADYIAKIIYLQKVGGK